MSKQKGVYLHGKAGNIQYYSWKGIACEKTIPAAVYQSPAVVAHKNANGLATTMGGSFRKLLAEVIPYPKDMQMQTALRLALLKWLKQGPVASTPPQQIPFITGLSFNEKASLKNCLHIPLIPAYTAGELSLQLPEMIPAISFSAPAGTQYIKLKLAVACCNIATGEALQDHHHTIHIPYNSMSIPSQAVSFPLQPAANSLAIIAVALHYYTNENGRPTLILNERYLPSEITGGVVTTS